MLLNRKIVKDLRSILDDALNDNESLEQFIVEIGNANFNDTEVTFKVNLRLKGAKSQSQKDLEDFAERKKKPSGYQNQGMFSNAMNYMENRTGWDMNRDGHVGQPIPPNMVPYQQYQQQQQQPMPMPAQAGGYINPNTGELLEAEQGPHIDKIAKKGKK